MHQKPTKTCITSAEFGRLYSDYNPRFTEVAYRDVRDRGLAEVLQVLVGVWCIGGT